MSLRVPAEFQHHPSAFIGGRYRARIMRVIDGDTFDIYLDEGRNQYGYDSMRIAGINAPEVSTPEGKLARDFARDRFEGRPAICMTSKDADKYGRYLATLMIYDDDHVWRDVGGILIAAGHAKAWDGKGPKP